MHATVRVCVCATYIGTCDASIPPSNDPSIDPVDRTPLAAADPGLCLRFVKMYKCVPIASPVAGEAPKWYLAMDLALECNEDGTGLGEPHGGFMALVTIVGLLTVLIPGYYAFGLWYYGYRQKTGKKLKKARPGAGEQVGDPLSELDEKRMKKAFGFFTKSYERSFYW